MHAASRWLQARFDRQTGSPPAAADSPPAATWEAEYAAGKWAYLRGLPEAGRYSVLAGYIAQLRPGGSVLDVGCGQGILLQRLPAGACSHYVGVDVSQSAVAAARAGPQDGRSTFLAVNCEDWIPPGNFAVIVFNEVLYYLHSPMSVLERYSRSLASGGILLLSLCLARRETPALLSAVARGYIVLDETRVTHSSSGLTWVCLALQPAILGRRQLRVADE